MEAGERFELEEAAHRHAAAGLGLAREELEDRLEVFVGPFAAFFLVVLFEEIEILGAVVVPDPLEPDAGVFQRQRLVWVEATFSDLVVDLLISRELEVEAGRWPEPRAVQATEIGKP